MSTLDEAIVLALQTGRTSALMDAEKLVRDRLAKTKWRSDARLLRVVADDIQRLGAES